MPGFSWLQSPFHLLGFQRSPLRVVDVLQMPNGREREEVLRSVQLFAYRDGAQVERLGVFVAPGVSVRVAEVLERVGEAIVLRAGGFLDDRERALVRRYRVVVAIRGEIQPAEVVQRLDDLDRVPAGDLLPDPDGALVRGLGPRITVHGGAVEGGVGGGARVR